MRIVVSGTHASGKSTLISDFALQHPEFVVLPDPFELIDETWDHPSVGMFAAQLRVSADRLLTGQAASFIAERGPLDFLAYLLALDELGDGSLSPELLERSAAIATEALSRVDLLVVLPLDGANPIEVDDDEHRQLRRAMNDILMDLLDDPDLLGDSPRVTEIVGGRRERLSVLEALVSGSIEAA